MGTTSLTNAALRRVLPATRTSAFFALLLVATVVLCPCDARAQRLLPQNLADLPVPGPFQLQVDTAGAFLAPGHSRQFMARRIFFRGDGTGAFSEDVTARATWNSLSQGIASVSTSGMVTALNPGTATIQAALGPLQASAQFTVSSTVMLNSISITPANQEVIVTAGNLTYTAIGSFSDNSTQDVSSTATWSSSLPAVATMNSNLAMLAGAGNTVISATVGSVSGSTVLHVAPQLTLAPQSASLTVLQTQQFNANLPVSWSVDGVAGGNSASGTISSSGEYAPTVASVGPQHIVTAASSNPPQVQQATVQVVSGFKGVFTYHNDNARTGLNPNEITLTPANVNKSTFGKLFTIPVDGKVDAQTLYVPNLTIPGKGTRNVLFVATEHDSVYAFDADTGTQYWHVSMLKSGESTSDARGCGQVSPEIGITATPAIDLNAGPNGTMYVVAMSKSGSTYFQRLHALDITTGADEFGGPVVIQATYPGKGDNSTNGNVVFDPKQYKERPGLLVVNGKVYTAWSSHCDARPYTSWIIAYDQNTLAQTSVINLTPNGSEAAFWNSGAGLAADSNGFIYGLSGNGTFDTTLNASGLPSQGDYGNAFIKLSDTGKLGVTDYFTMNNTISESDADVDLGSGGGLVLPDMADAQNQTRHLIIGAGKDTNIYVVDRDNMGKFNANNNNQVYQELIGVLGGGIWSMPAYFNNLVYFGAVGNVLKAFQFSQAQLSIAPVSQSATSYTYPGATPSISAAGISSAILWATENSNPAVLHAYDANDLSRELYNSNQAASSRDHFGAGNKFITPTIANGKVYVATTNGVGVFGLLP